MGLGDPRDLLLARTAAMPGESLASLSRLLGRNAAYLQQYVRRGSPRVLPERERRVLAGYLGVDEALLGGPEVAAPPSSPVPVRRLDVDASAGPGAFNDGDVATGTIDFSPGFLRALGVRGGAAALVRARGSSMEPGIVDGDRLLVDEDDRRPGVRGDVFVIRLDGALLVKRVARRGGRLRIASDNPAAPPVGAGTVEVVGRVVWLSRALPRDR